MMRTPVAQSISLSFAVEWQLEEYIRFTDSCNCQKISCRTLSSASGNSAGAITITSYLSNNIDLARNFAL